MNLENKLISRNEIFNVPYKLVIKNDKFNKEVSAEFDSNKIRLNILNDISYQDKVKKGLLDILFVNKNTELTYQVDNNSILFKTKNNKILNGSLDLKPFYLKADFSYDGISTKNLLTNDSIFIDLIKSEIFNNQNLNANLNLKVKDITNLNELNNLILKISLNQGTINLSDSKISWKDDLEITMVDGILDYSEDGIFLVGKLVIKANDISNFYKSFQIKKINRIDIESVELDFFYNFNENKFRFDNVKIDKVANDNLDLFIENYNSSNKIFTKKVIFQNFVKNFISAYAG